MSLLQTSYVGSVIPMMSATGTNGAGTPFELLVPLVFRHPPPGMAEVARSLNAGDFWDLKIYPLSAAVASIRYFSIILPFELLLMPNRHQNRVGSYCLVLVLVRLDVGETSGYRSPSACPTPFSLGQPPGIHRCSLLKLLCLHASVVAIFWMRP